MKFQPAIQLYTVRTALAADFEGTLQELARMGYKAVEFAWIYGGLQPAGLAALLDKLGLKACGFHLRLPDLLDAGSEGYAMARATRAPFVTASAAGSVRTDWRGTIRTLAQAAGIARAQGFAFTYHNHAEEFDVLDGCLALDILYEATDPDLVRAEIDVGFAAQRGQDPAMLIRRYGSRVAEVHLRDVPAGGGEFVELGRGTLDLKSVLAAARDAGARWAIVEQSVSAAELESARISLETLRRLEADGNS